MTDQHEVECTLITTKVLCKNKVSVKSEIRKLEKACAYKDNTYK